MLTLLEKPSAPDVELPKSGRSSNGEASGVCTSLPAALGHIDFIQSRRQEATKKEAQYQPSQPAPKKKGGYPKGKASSARSEET